MCLLNPTDKLSLYLDIGTTSVTYGMHMSARLYTTSGCSIPVGVDMPGFYEEVPFYAWLTALGWRCMLCKVLHELAYRQALILKMEGEKTMRT